LNIVLKMTPEMRWFEVCNLRKKIKY
jgi:hypothetical protein